MMDAQHRCYEIYQSHEKESNPIFWHFEWRAVFELPFVVPSVKILAMETIVALNNVGCFTERQVDVKVVETQHNFRTKNRGVQDLMRTATHSIR